MQKDNCAYNSDDSDQGVFFSVPQLWAPSSPDGEEQDGVEEGRTRRQLPSGPPGHLSDLSAAWASRTRHRGGFLSSRGTGAAECLKNVMFYLTYWQESLTYMISTVFRFCIFYLCTCLLYNVLLLQINKVLQKLPTGIMEEPVLTKTLSHDQWVSWQSLVYKRLVHNRRLWNPFTRSTSSVVLL